jgi:hypothetical protein
MDQRLRSELYHVRDTVCQWAIFREDLDVRLLLEGHNSTGPLAEVGSKGRLPLVYDVL